MLRSARATRANNNQLLFCMGLFENCRLLRSYGVHQDLFYISDPIRSYKIQSPSNRTEYDKWHIWHWHAENSCTYCFFSFEDVENVLVFSFKLRISMGCP